MHEPIDLDALEALLRNAESADWSVECEPSYSQDSGPAFTVYSGRSDGGHGLNLFGRLTDCDSFGAQNLALACAAVNALPALIAELREARENAELWKVEAEHYRDCAVGVMDARGGSCAVLVINSKPEIRMFSTDPDREEMLLVNLLETLSDVMGHIGVEVTESVTRDLLSDEEEPGV